MNLPVSHRVPLNRHHYACTGDRRMPVPLVLLHGWGGDSSIWEKVLPLFRERFDVITVDLPGFGGSAPCTGHGEALAMLADSLPPRAVLLGWSLGGMLATRFAHDYPQRVTRLITIATNARFTRSPDWPPAMAGGEFAGFARLFDDDPGTCLNQFSALQARGDGDERNLIRWLRARSGLAHGNWRGPLHWLSEMDNREILANLEVPSLHIFGARDHLVPVAAGELVGGIAPQAQVKVFPGVAHVPQVTAPERLVEACHRFLVAESPDADELDKQRIAQSFSRAAASYDRVADLQRDVGARLLDNITFARPSASLIDMGCGTGFFTRRLRERFPDAACTGVDIAPGMIQYASKQSRQGIHWLCADAEAVPLADGSQELIFSNFTFQWCQNLGAVMAEQYRLLCPSGVLAYTTVGPESLKELRRAWASVDAYVHVNRFASGEEVGGATSAAGFSIELWEQEGIVRHYRQLGDLTRELKGLGAHNINRGRNGGFTGKDKIRQLTAAYETFRQPRGLPASWQVYYVIARKPAQ